MNQISGKACYCSHADLVRAPINASQWFFSCPSFGFLSIFLSVVGLDPLPISTVRIPNRGARTRGRDRSLTPPLTNSELSSTSWEPDWWYCFMRLRQERSNRRARQIQKCTLHCLLKEPQALDNQRLVFCFIHPNVKAMVSHYFGL